MQEYYTSIIFIVCLLMIMVIVHLSENETLSKRSRERLRNVAELIALGAVCEFFGFFLDNSDEVPRYVHGIVKATEFSVAPIIAYCFLVLLRPIKSKFVSIFLLALLFIHTILEYTNIFIPFIFFIDESNVYVRGDYYYIYVASYLMSILLCVIGLFDYCNRHQSRNILSILTMALFLLLGFMIRMTYNGLHTDWLVVSIVFVMFIITYSDLYLKLDSLTGVLNRRTYDNRLKSIDYSTVIIIFDVNSFKKINDTYNHQCGDIILRVVAQDILKVYKKYGYCYRIGGDEFCVIFKRGKMQELIESSKGCNINQIIDMLNRKFDDIIDDDIKKYPMLDEGVSKGVAIYISENDHDDMPFDNYCSKSINDVINIADEKMYEEKNQRIR